jgi:hypothetical protein
MIYYFVSILTEGAAVFRRKTKKPGKRLKKSREKQTEKNLAGKMPERRFPAKNPGKRG